MALNKKIKYFIIIALTLFSLYSCQTILKAYTGIKNPKLELSSDERLEYYNPFIENSDSNFELINTFNKYQNYPLIFIQDRTIENDIYLLNCFEDVSYNIENINMNNFEGIIKGKTSELSDLKAFLDTNAEVTYSNFIDKNKKWNVYIISGTFLGNKLRKRMLPIMQLQDLNKVLILDLSTNENSTNN
jgi:hypothetical protein